MRNASGRVNRGNRSPLINRLPEDSCSVCRWSGYVSCNCVQRSTLEKLAVAQLAGKFPPFFGTRIFVAMCTSQHCTVCRRSHTQVRHDGASEVIYHVQKDAHAHWVSHLNLPPFIFTQAAVVRCVNRCFTSRPSLYQHPNRLPCWCVVLRKAGFVVGHCG